MIIGLHFQLSYRRNHDGLIPSLAHLLNGFGFIGGGGLSDVWGAWASPSTGLAPSLLMLILRDEYRIETDRCYHDYGSRAAGSIRRCTLSHSGYNYLDRRLAPTLFGLSILSVSVFMNRTTNKKPSCC